MGSSCGLYRAIKGFIRSNKQKYQNGIKHNTRTSFRKSFRKKQVARNPLTPEAAAVRIQTAFRGYRVRRAFRRLKVILRFQVETEGGYSPAATAALRQISRWSRMQSEIRARRAGMAVYCQKRVNNQMKIQAKHHELQVEWNSNRKSMREIHDRKQQREAAAARRQRAMSYAVSHQWRVHAKRYLGHSYFV